MSGSYEVTNPATLELINELRFDTTADVDAAVEGAAEIFETSWSFDAEARSGALRSWAAEIRRHQVELADALVAQVGKTIRAARSEVASCAERLDYYAGMARYVGGRAGTLSDGSEAHLVREPIGVTAIIVPYNAPATLLIRDLAPALAAGVTAVVKPAPQASLITLRLVELGHRAGLPKGAVSVVVGDQVIGEHLVAHPLVRAVAFTGSSEGGRAIGRIAADGFKHTLLELGGKSVSIVFPDADLSEALTTSLAASVNSAGQECTACTRVLVHSSCLDQAVKHLAVQAQQIMVGDPRNDATQVGPLISRAHLARVAHYLELASADGEVVHGGEQIHPDGLPGYFLTPAIIAGVPTTSPVVQDDIFGPVLTVEAYEDEQEAIALANATRFGLTAAVWTASLDTALRAGRKIQAGTVWINGYNKKATEIPSGGMKNSGLGRTRGVEGIEEFTVLKNIHMSIHG
jgi:acyl-CoA reductase-like NAD-dependent aldehyde dehydrogenase